MACIDSFNSHVHCVLLITSSCYIWFHLGISSIPQKTLFGLRV